MSKKKNKVWEEHFEEMLEKMDVKDMSSLISWGGHMYDMGVRDACKCVAGCGLICLVICCGPYAIEEYKKRKARNLEETRENPTT